MDILAGLRIAIDTFWYNIIVSFAGLHWSLLRGMVMMGHTVELINQWLSENVFGVLIAQTNASLQTAISFAFVIALSSERGRHAEGKESEKHPYHG